MTFNDAVLEEARRLSDRIEERTRGSMVNATRSVFVVLAPAVFLGLDRDVPSEIYCAVPVLLSVFPLLALEDDKETRALVARLAVLERAVNLRFKKQLLVFGQDAKDERLIKTQIGLYAFFTLIWLISWGIGAYLASRLGAVPCILYVAFAVLILAFAFYSWRSSDVLVERLKREPSALNFELSPDIRES